MNNNPLYLYEANVYCYKGYSLLSIAFKKSKSKRRKEKKVNHFTDLHGLPCIDKIVTSVDETPESITTDIIGKIPEWINGNFLRNGPGKFEIGDQT